MSRKPNVAIVGAGLGGSTIAILLQRAGYHCKIYEQSPAFQRVGAGINLAPNSLRVMREMGVLTEMLKLGNQPNEKSSRHGQTGELLYRADIPALEKEYGAPFVAIHRGDFQALLYNAIKPGTIEFGKRLKSLSADTGYAKLLFEDGTLVESDIVIGADGVNSKIRESLVGPEPPTYSGVTAYRSTFPSTRLNGLKLDDYTKWWGEGNDVVAYYTTCQRDEFYVLALCSEPWNESDFAVRAGDTGHVQTVFAEFHPDVQRIIAACPDAFRAPILHRNPSLLWTFGNIVMLGDACHPMAPYMGQGAGMAIEDAVILARCIESVNGEDLSVAFSNYQHTRFERTTKVQQESDKNSWMKTKMEHAWIYGYDVLTAPLADAKPNTTTAGNSDKA